MTPGPYGRLTLLALAVLFTASSCSMLAVEPLALVQGSPRPLADSTSSEGTDRVVTTEFAMPAPTPTAKAARASTTASRGDAPTPRSKPKIKVIRLKPRPKPGPFSMNLYAKGDFVHQQTKDWCVAGSTQTMINIIDEGKPNRSAALQKRLYLKGRALSPNKRKLGPIGVDLIGWAELLNTHGYGPYVVESARTRRGAIHKAARAMRLTGRPVGLVTWRGAHSWVMSGFTASADPAHTRNYKVKKVYVQDVWYPYVSTIWGASRPPNALVPVAALAEDYLPYRRPRARWPKRDGRFMLILPVLPKNTVAR